MLADVDREALRRRGADGFGGASHPDVQRSSPGRAATIGALDVVLVAVARRRAPPPAAAPTSTATPACVGRAAHRHDVEVYGDDVGLVVVGRGLVDRCELAVELLDPRRTAGPATGAG